MTIDQCSLDMDRGAFEVTDELIGSDVVGTKVVIRRVELRLDAALSIAVACRIQIFIIVIADVYLAKAAT